MAARLKVVASICALLFLSGASPEPITLQQYTDIRFKAVEERFSAQEKAVAAALAAQEKAVSAALAAADRAVAKAEVSADKRFESVNEFRTALSDRDRLNMPRTEAEQQLKSINEKVDALTARINARDEQNRGQNQGWVVLVAAIAAIGSLVGIAISLYTVRSKSAQGQRL
jgi:hypothetical protein